MGRTLRAPSKSTSLLRRTPGAARLQSPQLRKLQFPWPRPFSVNFADRGSSQGGAGINLRRLLPVSFIYIYNSIIRDNPCADFSHGGRRMAIAGGVSVEFARVLS